MSQSSYFKFLLDLLKYGGGGWSGKPEILKNAYKCRRFVIDATGLDPLSLEELGGWIQCFGEFGASGCARTIKLVGVSGSRTN